MADAEKPKPPESPTTARELDFDDDEDLATSSPKPPKPVAAIDSASSAPAPAGGLQPPAQPPRPMSPREQAELTLQEAFPTIDAAVIKAVLRASNGQVEPAFNALLGMSDPSAVQHDQQYEPARPPQPPRPPPPSQPGRSQVEADEAYARRLAEHYQHQAYSASRQQQSRPRDQHSPQGLSPNQQGYYEGDRERSFIDDDLPVIRDNIRKGFLETQTKFNSFFTNLKKQIDGEEEESPPPPPPRRPTQQGGQYARRSGDHGRYDADPQVISDDFTALQLRDDTAPARPSAGRPAANPDLFKPTPATPPSQPRPGQRVSFQEGPPEEIKESQYRASPDPTKAGSPPSGKNSKWQPLAAVDPDPVAEHDPFSLGDSDDDEAKKKDPKAEDAERLKRATAEAMADNLGTPSKTGADATAKES